MLGIQIDKTGNCSGNYQDTSNFAYESAEFIEDRSISMHPIPQLPEICSGCKFEDDCEIFAIAALEALKTNPQ